MVPMSDTGSESGESSQDSSEDEMVTWEDDAGGGHGRHALSIPSATANFDVSGTEVKIGNPLSFNDIRRFLLPGDIANILGGNVWGHCGLIIRATEVYRFPVLYGRSAATPFKDKKEGRLRPIVELDFNVDVFILDLLQSASNMPTIFMSQIGVVIHPETHDICMVKRIRGGVLLRESHDGGPLVIQILMSPFTAESLNRQLLSEAVTEVLNTPEMRWSKATAVRAFFRHALLKPSRYKKKHDRQRLAAHLQEGWLVRPVCSTVPPRVWQKYLQKRSMLPRAPLPVVNTDGLKVSRGRKSGSLLLYCGQGMASDDMMEDDDDYRWCYVCGCGGNTHQKLCGPHKGKQCISCLRAQWTHPSDDPDPQVAFAEDVLRIIPLKDDRVLPEELVTNLLSTGLWSQLNIRAGVPPHRRVRTVPARRSYATHRTL
ncbi:unnamed protein product [Durusdinium trenchii]|uniref:Uncharacterized protein n=1 Tax=Durusdinium trenchii TaxID=1381693 RepID=A0ABP0S2L7_9DINO